MRHVGRKDLDTGLLVTEISAAELDALPEYSCSLPTGTEPGKMWRRRVTSRWFLGRYYEVAEPGQVGIEWRKLEVTA